MPIFGILRIFVKKENIVLFIASNMYRYSGNTKYLYQYFNTHSNDKCYWITESKEVINHLKTLNYRYISNDNPFKKLFVILKSKVIYSSGTSFYDPFGLISNDKNIIKICTMHGTGPKLTIERSNDVKKTLKLISDINSYDFISLSTEYARDIIGFNQLVLPKSKIKILGTPKQDALLDEKYIQKKYNEKNIIKNIFGSKYKNQKIIYYTPTFRDYKSTLPLIDISEFNENDFNKFLTENNLLFLYSYHSMSNFNMVLKETDNIRFIDNNENHLFDNIELMTEIDLLVGDYSTLSTDFSILNKPQLFIIPDYKQINDTKGFAEDLRKMMPGKEISTYQELCINILKNINNVQSYLKEFNENISELSRKYIEDRKLTSCEKFLRFHNDIKKL